MVFFLLPLDKSASARVLDRVQEGVQEGDALDVYAVGALGRMKHRDVERW